MTSKDHKQLAADLSEMLAGRFAGITVEVGMSDRWNRPCVTFRWPGFGLLMPEERFHRLMEAIPGEFAESRMAGFVWLELEPDESVDQFLKLPRSEDVLDREPAVYAGLRSVNFFDLLAEEMSPAPQTKCDGDFALAETVLSRSKYSAAKIRDAKLVFIRHGVYCDCQVLEVARPELAAADAGAA